MDRNGLRPFRYVVTDDDLVIGGSEAGMVSVDEAAISEKGAPGPGQMLAVDTKVHRFLRDRDLKDELAASQPFGDRVNSITNLEETIGTVREQALYTGEELRRRQAAAGYTIEDLEMILHPMAEDAREAVASMGDGTPPAALSDDYGPLSHCHSDTCPVGVCTQRDNLRSKFTGTPEKVVNLITFYAQEIQETLASLGARSLDEVIGRPDMLMQTSRGAGHLDDLDLNPTLSTVDADHSVVCDRNRPRQVVPDTLDADIIRDGEKMQLSYSVLKTLRAVGARVSSHIVRRFGMKNSLVDDHLTIKLTGSAGQSLGAFAAPGPRIEVDGDANDYVGKGLPGGTIVIRPPKGSRLDPSRNTIIGNTVRNWGILPGI